MKNSGSLVLLFVRFEALSFGEGKIKLKLYIEIPKLYVYNTLIVLKIVFDYNFRKILIVFYNN
jgi:hypothetical protein